MTLTQLILAELEREAPRTRRALEQVPFDRDDRTPHPKSMPLGRLAGLVASMVAVLTISPPSAPAFQMAGGIRRCLVSGSPAFTRDDVGGIPVRPMMLRRGRFVLAVVLFCFL